MQYTPKPNATRKAAKDHSNVAPIHKPASKPKHTGGVPKPPAMPTKRPMVGNDKAMNTKYGSASHNNGYTN
jgi:hypothetical protein